ncbi:uncharacterized protein LOC134206050 [Armigeres subalbatus]|uniref:uncharacterized protein LOC134206050 n=1 Tax=Armigeres subalbatus TaxID=124917 RepID=UPI002ED200AA
MATRMKIDAAVMPAFSIGSDPRNDWMKWKRAFERFIAANGVTEDEEKYNLLLVIGGIELQTYFDKLDSVQVGVPIGTDGASLRILKYESAVFALDSHFAPQLNKRFERHQFRALKLEQSEVFEDFLFRLKGQASRCKFSDPDDMIVDQVIEGCVSVELRKKLLTEEKTLTEVVQLGKTIEEVQKHAMEYGSSSMAVQGLVDKISRKPGLDRNNRKCYNCNRSGHIAKDISKCPASNASCFNCGNKGHFKFCCRKRKTDCSSKYNEPKKRVYAVVGCKTEETENGVFFVSDEGPSEILEFFIGGIPVSLVVDSGSPANIIREDTYRKLQQSRARIVNERKADKTLKLEAFASNDKIVFSTAFEAEIRTPEDENAVWAHFLVAPKGQTNLLSKTTAFALGVLRIGYKVNMITDGTSDTGSKEFPKIPGVTLRIQVDESVRPVIQAPRRLPIAMEAEVEEVIRDLIDKAIIERAEGPLSWVSPLVPVRKSNGKIRLCVHTIILSF